MTPEKTLDFEIWFVLQQIVKESLLSGDTFTIPMGEPFKAHKEYKDAVPTFNSQHKILGRLKRDGAILIETGLFELEPYLPVMAITVVRPKFDEIYEKYKQDTGISAKLDFVVENSILLFAGKSIKISKRAQSAPHDLLRTLFKDKTKTWSTDEVLDDWNYYDENEKIPKNKVYQSGLAVNSVVAEDTTIKDFLEPLSTKNVAINKKYLNT